MGAACPLRASPLLGVCSVCVLLLLCTTGAVRATTAAADRTKQTVDNATDSYKGLWPIAGRDERRRCPLWQHAGCMLDVLEAMCAAPSGAGPALFDTEQPVNIWGCCCPLPHAACNVTEQDPTCKASVAKRMAPLGRRWKKGEEFFNRFLTVVQQVREDLINAGGAPCQDVLAPSQPYSACSKAGADERGERTIARFDLFCETTAWQWEELGDGDFEEMRKNNCTLPPLEHKAPVDKSNKRLGAGNPPRPTTAGGGREGGGREGRERGRGGKGRKGRRPRRGGEEESGGERGGGRERRERSRGRTTGSQGGGTRGSRQGRGRRERESSREGGRRERGREAASRERQRRRERGRAGGRERNRKNSTSTTTRERSRSGQPIRDEL